MVLRFVRLNRVRASLSVIQVVARPAMYRPAGLDRAQTVEQPLFGALSYEIHTLRGWGDHRDRLAA